MKLHKYTWKYSWHKNFNISLVYEFIELKIMSISVPFLASHSSHSMGNH